MSKVKLENRSIWITGASSGIGRSLAESLLARGNKLFLTARNEAALAELKAVEPESIHIVPADISVDQSIDQMRSQLSAHTAYLDTVILNAGTCEYMDVENFETAIIERVFQVNTIGMARCIEVALPFLQASENSPHIIGVSSAAALTGLPRAEAYGASKAAVVSMLESLALDLTPSGIDVSVVYPGFVDTPLTRKNDFPMPFILNQKNAVRLMSDGIERRGHKIMFPKPLIWGLKLMAMLPEGLRHRAGLSMVRV
jgi:short-subunit dehydrogenase